MSELEDVIKTSDVIVWDGRYAYLQCDALPTGKHFVVSQDEDEVTVVTEEHLMDGIKYKSDTKWFKVLEIRVSKPFIAKGFLACVTKTVAEKDLNILILSTYSKDYALVREETADIAIKALEDRGFNIKYKHKEAA